MTLITTAKKYLGITEITNNSGWKDQDFESRMKACGWNIGEAYCSYWVELVLKEAYPERFKEFDQLFSGSAIQTYKNFKDKGYRVSSVPVVGSIVIWQQYKGNKPSWQGHAGLCYNVISPTVFRTYEANTSATGSRDGTIITTKLRTTARKATGLNVLGFIIIE